MLKPSLLQKFAANFLLAVMVVNLGSTVAVNAETTDFGMTVDAGADQAVAVGETVSLNATISGVDVSIPFASQAVVEWGDDTWEWVTPVAGTSDFTVVGSHAYSTADTYTVSVIVTTQDGLNTVTDELTVAVGPNLTVTDIRYELDSDGEGDYEVYADLANTGVDDVDPILDGVNIGYLNGTAEVTYSWSIIAAEAQAFLAAGGTTGSAYSALGGNKFLVNGDEIEVCVDVTDVSAESDETDNCYSETVVIESTSSMPDLTVTNVAVDLVDYSLDITVNNEGDADVAEDANPEMTIATTTPDTTDTDLTGTYVLEDYITADADFRLAGTSMILSIPVEEEDLLAYCAATSATESTWAFFVYVDSTEAVTEESEDNNTYETTFDICADAAASASTSGPDMVGTIDSWTEDLVVYYTISNEGDEDVDTAVITDNLGTNYFYIDDVYFGQTRWYWHTLVSLRYTAAGGSQTRGLYLYYYDDFATLSDGTHILTVCTDATDAVSETDESNNCEDFEIEWTHDMLPDLYATALSIDTATGAFNYDLGNIGATDLWLGWGYNAVYLNGSAVVTQAWYTDVNYNYLTAMTSENRTTTLDTSLFVEGTNEVEVCADSTNKILSELDEANNCSALSFEYSIPEETVDAFAVVAGADQAVAINESFVLDDEAYAYNLASESLTSATISWGDGSATETATQLVSGELIYLQGSHVYSGAETYTVTVCANDGVSGELCDTLSLSVVGNSSNDSPGVSSGGSGGGSSGNARDEEIELDAAVELSSEESACSGMLFEDVSVGDSFYDSICALWAADVIHGKTDTFFDTKDFIRRDEASKIFTRLFDYVTEAYGETPDLEESSFVDVDASDPLAYYVEVAATENIMDYYTADPDTGADTGWYFEPHDAMTMEDIKQSLTAITGDETIDLSVEGTEYMTRGSFVDFVYSFIE